MKKNKVIQQAEEFAGAFYTQCDMFMDRQRSKRFRETYPTLKAYMRGQQHTRNGDIIIDKPAYRYFEKRALEHLCRMLATNISEREKEEIYEDILAYQEKARRSTLKTTQHIERQPLN